MRQRISIDAVGFLFCWPSTDEHWGLHLRGVCSHSEIHLETTMFSFTAELEMEVFLLSSQLWHPMQRRAMLAVLHAASLCDFICAAVLL